MQIINCVQGTDEWFEYKRGKPSASRYSEIVTSTGEPSKSRVGYLYELAAQRISGIYEESHKSKAMMDGNEREAHSRWRYAMENDVVVEEVGFCLSDCGRFGASPDGLVGDDGQIELKNPIGKTQIKRLRELDSLVSMGYYQQCQGQLLVTKRNWNDFVSCYSGLPLYTIRVEPDHEFLIKLERELVAFCEELDEICEKLGDA